MGNLSVQRRHLRISRHPFTLILILTLGISCAFPPSDEPLSPQIAPSPADPVTFEGELDPETPARVLLYNGPTAWHAEIASLAAALRESQISFHVLDAKETNELSVQQWKNYSLTIIPGGYAPTLSDSLTQQTKLKLRRAVQQNGMSYLGFCAGAWLAISPPEPSVEERSYGLGLIDGGILQDSRLIERGVPYLIVQALLWNGVRRPFLWYGGPRTPETSRGVVARYPDGSPAITQLRAQAGLLILSGLHPSITPTVLSDLGLTETNAYAPDITHTLIQAGLRKFWITDLSN